MTTLVIGLGNPGSKYHETRHNIGFAALDCLRDDLGAPEFRPETKLSAELSSVVVNGHKVILAKPLVYMNESGRTVRALLDYYRLDLESLIIIHDDLDIAPGTLRTTNSSRAAGHNGVQNIIDSVGTQDFFRIRLGIGRPTKVTGTCMPSHDYVLGRFSEEEFAKHATLFEEVIMAVRNRLDARQG